MSDKQTIENALKLGNELFDLADEKRNKEIEALPDGDEKDKLLKEKAQSEKKRIYFNATIKMANTTMLHFAKLAAERLNPRFEPNDEAWIPYKDKAISVDVVSVYWRGHYIEYEIETLNELMHQTFETYEDVEDKNCLLFETREQCEEYIKLNAK